MTMRLGCAGEARQAHREDQAKAWRVAVRRGARFEVDILEERWRSLRRRERIWAV